MPNWKKGLKILRILHLTLSGIILIIGGFIFTIIFFIGAVSFPIFGFSVIPVIAGLGMIMIGTIALAKGLTYEDPSEKPVKSESEIDENTSFEELQEIIKRRGW